VCGSGLWISPTPENRSVRFAADWNFAGGGFAVAVLRAGQSACEREKAKDRTGVNPTGLETLQAEAYFE